MKVATADDVDEFAVKYEYIAYPQATQGDAFRAVLHLENIWLINSQFPH